MMRISDLSKLGKKEQDHAYRRDPISPQISLAEGPPFALFQPHNAVPAQLILYRPPFHRDCPIGGALQGEAMVGV